MRYFIMSQGIRGAYLLDHIDVTIPFTTRKELKQNIALDVQFWVRSFYLCGCTQKEIASAAAALWRGEQVSLHYGPRGGSKPHVLKYEPLTRKEWLQMGKELQS